jgi:hypothetical protein
MLLLLVDEMDSVEFAAYEYMITDGGKNGGTD